MDLDGVWADCNAGLLKVLGMPYPKGVVFHRTWIEDNATSLSVHELFEEAHKDARFWENLSVKPHCSEMMAFLDEHAPDWGILTSAWRHPQCYSGKFNWVKENLGRDVLKRLVIASGQKERLARKDAMLVDDRVDIINKWHEAGGATFHWIEYSNEQIENLSSQLEAWKQAVLEHQARTRYAIRNDH